MTPDKVVQTNGNMVLKNDPVNNIDPTGNTAEERQYWSKLWKELGDSKRTNYDDAMRRSLQADLSLLMFYNEQEEDQWNRHVSNVDDYKIEQDLRAKLVAAGVHVNALDGFTVVKRTIRPSDSKEKSASYVGWHTDIYYNGEMIRLGSKGDVSTLHNKIANDSSLHFDKEKPVAPGQADRESRIIPLRRESGNTRSDEQMIHAIIASPVPGPGADGGISDIAPCNIDVIHALESAGLIGYECPADITSKALKGIGDAAATGQYPL